MTVSNIEQELREHGQVLIQATGISMEPLLHPRKSSMLMKKPVEPLKVNDVVLFLRPNGDYVLHRIVKVLGDKYVIRGDNALQNEPVHEKQILGVMVGFFADESDKFTECDDPKYLRYVSTVPLRYFYRRTRAFCGRVIRKLKTCIQ